MKYLFLSCILMLSNINYTYKDIWPHFRNFNELSQEVLSNIDSLGIKNSHILNEYEVQFFESLFKENAPDLNDKKIGFIFSRTKTSNKYYFEDVKKRYKNAIELNDMSRSANLACCLLILTEEQKIQSGGYDIVILYWSKRLPSDKQLIEILLKDVDDYYL